GSVGRWARGGGGLGARGREGAQGGQGGGMAGSGEAEFAVETALPPPPRRMPQVRLAGGGLSLGRAVGARDYGAVECGGDTGSGDGVARNGTPLPAEPEERC